MGLSGAVKLYISPRLVSILRSMYIEVTSWPVFIALQNTWLEIEQCQLSTEMTEKLWSSLRSYTPLNHLTISESSLSFPPSPPELPSVTKLWAEKVTSQSYVGVLSSLPGLEEVDITIGDANTEDISQIRTSLHRHLTGQDLTRINLHSFTSEGSVSSMSRMRGLGLLITDYEAILSGVFVGPKETVIDLVQSSTRLMSASLYAKQWVTVMSSQIHWKFVYHPPPPSFPSFGIDMGLLFHWLGWCVKPVH